MSYYVAGTMERVSDPNLFLKKEEDHCRKNPDFLKSWWTQSGNEVSSFIFENALENYLQGLKEDVKNDASYVVL